MRLLIATFSLLMILSSQATTLRVVSEDLPPLQIAQHNEKPSGALVEVVNLLLTKVDMPVNIEILPWARSYQIAQEQGNTIIFSMLRDKSREDKFQWIGKIYSLKSFLVTLKSNKKVNITSIEQAKQYSIASVREDLASNYLQEHGFVEGENLFLSSNYKVLWQMLYGGRTDLAFTNDALWPHEIKAAALDPAQIRIVYKVDDVAQDLYIAASLTTDKKIVTKLKKALKEIKQNGEYQRILDKWHLII